MNSNKDNKIINKIANKDNNVVSTIGNAWIICRSKSYPGRVYYFNTVSGEAAWNLSDAELEKAKKTTLESEHEFPEPLESPQDYVCGKNYTQSMLHSTAAPKIYNKQIINNKFPRQPQPSTSFNHYAQFSTLNSVGFGIPTYTPLMNVPANSIILASPLNTLQPGVDHNYNCMQKNQAFNSPIPLSKGFQNLQYKSTSTSSPFHSKILNKRNILQNKNLQNESNSTMDLRQKLHNMRNTKQNLSNTVSRGPAYPMSNSKEVVEDENIAIENNKSIIDDTIEPILSDTFSEELILEMNVDALKNFFGISPNSEHWFIVADEDVLLNYTNFMIKLLQLDERSRLVIPQVVIIKIQKSTTSVHNQASLQAASFISQALESNVAIIDEDNYETNQYYEDIFNCCMKLVNQNCDVIFISGKNVSYNDLGFSIFTMMDIKAFLVNKKVKEDPKITIIIPNDNENLLNSNLQRKSRDVRTEEVKCKDSKGSQFPLLTKDMCVQTENISHTMDVAVQVDFDIPNPTLRLRYDEFVSHMNDKTQLNECSKPTNKLVKRPRLKRRPLCGSTAEITNNLSNATANCRDNKSFIDAATNTKVHDSTTLYQISSKAMEDYLKMKSDEWVSRFVQIMEEALTQILQQDPTLVLDMPPPWTMYEASECIKRKFTNDCEVFDAASKLSNILFEMGGLRGKINNNIDPEMYMKMYSCGYNLVDALLSLICNNEDLQIAGTSLIKLLSDIQNPHLDPSNSDSFTDPESTRQNDSSIYTNKFVQKELSIVNSQKATLIESTSISNDVPHLKAPCIKSNDISTIRIGCVPTQNIKSQEMTKKGSPTKPKIIRQSPRVNKEEMHAPTDSLQQIKYNLRNRKPLEDNNEQKNQIIREHICPKDSFLTNFNLMNRNGEINTDTDAPINEINSTKKHSFDDQQTEGQKVTRKFTMCPEYEKRLRNKSNTFSKEIFDDQKLDYEYENIDESFTSELDDADDNERVLDSNPYCAEEETPLKQPECFRHFLDEVGIKVKESFLKVYSFCDNSRNKLLSSKDNNENLEIRKKAEKMRTYVENMCLSLKRILDRETNDSQEGACKLLIKMGYKSKDIDEKELEYYRSFISRCVVQGDILLQSVKLIIEATLEKV